jgi:hypothetical protein
MKFFTKIILLVLSLSLSILAKDVATVTALNGEAFIQRDGTKISVTLGIKLQEKDTIITSQKAKVQVIFSDETIITIGKNSNFSINEFLFEEDTEPVAKFSMLKGAMRTITGKIGKIAPEKFTVKAKTATIGIRGTNFTVNIEEDGTTNVYCTFGAISTTFAGTQYIVNQGYFIAISPAGTTEIKEFQAEDLKEVKKQFSKSEKKDGIVSDDATISDEAQIDITTEDFEVKDITESLTDDEQLSTLDSSLADLLSSYTMTDAVYSGTYNLTQSQTGYLTSGYNATMNVDFSNDTIELKLANTEGSYYTFNSTDTVETNFNLNFSGAGTGNASGSFTGDTGNSANGTFNYTDTNSYTDKGTFNVTSSQTLK